MHQEAITRAAIRNINISQRRNEREKPQKYNDKFFIIFTVVTGIYA